MDVTSAINSLGNDYVAKVTDAMKQSAAVNNTNGSAANQTFDSIFYAVSGLDNSRIDNVQQAEQAQIDFGLGKLTNTHVLGVNQQQANIALQFTVAVRDKALEAYKEIMNMQI